MKAFAKMLGVTLLWIAMADVAGALIVLVLEIFDFLLFNSRALFFVLWFTLGFFSGLFAFSYSNDIAAALPKGEPEKVSATDDDSPRDRFARYKALAVVLAITVLLGYGNYLMGDDGVNDSNYVPDNSNLTYTFLVAIIIGMMLSFFSSASEKPKPQSSESDKSAHSATTSDP